MALKQVDNYPAGGVSSRDNPITMPVDRYLRMRNFWPQQDGSLRLRDGYSLYASGIQIGVAIHSIKGVVGPAPDYKRLIVFWQGTTPYILDPATKVAATTIVRGVPIQSSNRFCYFYTNGHLHAFNGVDAKWFDGFVWRDVGLPKPDADSIAALNIVTSVREFSASEASAVTLTLAGGGTFPADKTGRTFYCAIYDLDLQEIGPATIPIGPSAGFKKFGLNQELQVAVLPSLTNTRWRKLPALTDDGKSDGRLIVVDTKPIIGGAVVAQSFALAGSSANNNQNQFPTPSFSVSLSAGDLSGGPATATIMGTEQSIPDPTLAASATLTFSGSDSVYDFVDPHGGHHPIPDAGTIGARIIGTNNFDRTFSISYGPSVSPTSLATSLASAINNDPSGFLSAVASGATVVISATPGGAANVYSVAPFTHTSEPQYFIDNQSFHISSSVGQFGTRTIYDTGTVQITVNGSPAVATYGANDSGITIAAKLAMALNALNIGIQASSADAQVTIAASQVGFFVNLTITNSGWSTDDVIGISASGDAAYDGQLFTVIAVNGNLVTIFAPLAKLPIQSGTAQKLLVLGAATTTATITAPTFFTPYRVNDLRGIPGSAIGGTQPGYQFYGSLYLRTAGGHVGNRVKIGTRIAPTTRTNIRMIGTILFADTEQELLLGRTGDGAEVPYAMIDNSGTWLSVNGSSSIVTISDADIDGDSELPSRNYPPPGTLDFNAQIAPDDPISGTFKSAWVESDHCCGALAGKPTVYRSGSAQDVREGKFVGLPEQSWSPVDIETFPTAAPITSGQGYAGESLVASKEDSATLIELAGETSWQGPYNLGIAGQFAYAKGWKNLPFVLTGEKQLATGTPDGPIPISDEYEAALLSKIGDQYLPDSELEYIRLPHKRVEVLRVSARDENGLPFSVIHDFNLRDSTSPFGQAYEERLTGSIALGQELFSTPNSSLSRSKGKVTYTRLFTIPLTSLLPVVGGHAVVISGGTFDGTFGITDVSYVAAPPPSLNHTLTVTWEQDGIDDTTAVANVDFSGPALQTLAVVRDENDQPLVLCGASDGNIYKLYDGISDNGTFFTAEALSLQNIGPQRSSLQFVEWYGDPNLKIFVAKRLTTPYGTNQMQALCPDGQGIPGEVQDDQGSNHYIVDVSAEKEMRHAYVLLQLTGQDGGTMELNDPPHRPVEVYGRVWLVSPLLGASRSR